MIAVDNLAIAAGAFRLEGLTFAVPTGMYGVLMGRSGSGKTTLAEAICGLKPVLAGRVRLMESDATALAPGERGIGYVPQDGVLFPSMTVYEHLAFALRVRRESAKAIAGRVDELAGLLAIEPLLKRRVRGLSGGERQRVALGRALSFRPRVLVLDEPLSALDRDSRADACALLETVQAHTGATFLHITHDRAEAARLADRLFAIEDGAVRDRPLAAEGP